MGKKEIARRSEKNEEMSCVWIRRDVEKYCPLREGARLQRLRKMHPNNPPQQGSLQRTGVSSLNLSNKNSAW